jgi:hypothetical protein
VEDGLESEGVLEKVDWRRSTKEWMVFNMEEEPLSL